MNIEQQIICFESAIQLHNAGLDKPSYYMRLEMKGRTGIFVRSDVEANVPVGVSRQYPAYTATELLEMLPLYINYEGSKCKLIAMFGDDEDGKRTYSMNYRDMRYIELRSGIRYNEAEARQDILMKLIKKRLYIVEPKT